MGMLIVTPAPPGSRKGNRITAERWARRLRELGREVRIAERYHGEDVEILIALHARRSAASVARFHAAHPQRPLILCLTGTDLYGDIRTDVSAQASLEYASRLVLLQAEGRRELPDRLQAKTRVIHQSVAPFVADEPAREDVFEVCVLGHLRPVKDPFRAAAAARRLPADSRILITHAGAALDAAMADRARVETEGNSRYEWVGELAHDAARRLLARSRLLALTSLQEGGANVVSEAIAAGTPVISSRISGSIGLLGGDYPGYFPPGDTEALAALLRRVEVDEAFRERLRARCLDLRPLVEPSREREAWRELLAELNVAAGAGYRMPSA